MCWWRGLMSGNDPKRTYNPLVCYRGEALFHLCQIRFSPLQCRLLDRGKLNAASSISQWLGGAIAACPLTLKAQPVGHLRRIGVLFGSAQGDRQAVIELTILKKTLEELGWTEPVRRTKLPGVGIHPRFKRDPFFQRETMSHIEIFLIVIAALLLGIIWQLDKIRQHVDTTRRIAWIQHFGDPPSD